MTAEQTNEMIVKYKQKIEEDIAALQVRAPLQSYYHIKSGQLFHSAIIYHSWRFDLFQFGSSWTLVYGPMDLVKGSWMELLENAVANILKNWKIFTLKHVHTTDF